MSLHLERALNAREAAAKLALAAESGDEKVHVAERLKLKEASKDMVSTALMHAAIAQAAALEQLVEHMTHQRATKPDAWPNVMEGTKNA